MGFGKNDITGAVSGLSTINVWDDQGRLKVIGGGTPPPPAPVVWGSITGLVTNQTDLINYLGLNFYPLSSNPAGYLTQTAADARYYPLTSNPSGFITAAALAGYVPNTRTLTINGTSYDLSADRSWTIPAGGTVTSVGLTVPSAFSVTPGSITVSGTFVITGAGTVSQYIDGTGALQTFPTIPTVIPSALTKTDDTNVTLTLGGTPATALLQSVSLTLGWTGILATGRGGTGLSSIGTALQYLRVNSGGTALEYATFPTIPAQYNPTAGTGISITGSYPDQTITNTLPDQTVVLTPGTGIGITGTYPSFTIDNTIPGITYTVDNGLTPNPTATNFQLGGLLLLDTSIDGNSGTYSLNFSDLYKHTAITYDYIQIKSEDIGITNDYSAEIILDHRGSIYKPGFTLYLTDTVTGDTAGIEAIDNGSLGVPQLWVKPRNYSAASTGDVLTLQADGTVEYQTPTTTTGDSLSPLLLMGG